MTPVSFTSLKPLSKVTQCVANYRYSAAGILASIIMTGCGTAPSKQTALATPENFPDGINDPFEPLNRGVSKLNEKLVHGVIRPSTHTYRTVAPEPVRNSVTNFSHNINYPVRLVNTIAQGRWKDAGDDSLRFLSNSTVGIAGLLDPATKWNIPKPEADSAQTLHKWGWKPNNFLMLPLLGPSDDLHAAGQLVDKAAEPWNYISNLSPIGGGIVFNRLSGQTEPIVQFLSIEADPYVGLKYLWKYSSKQHQPDWSIKAPLDPPSLRTLEVTTIAFDDPEFAYKGKQGSVRSSTTGKKMKFNYWFQKHSAPLVFITPGTGGHRVSGNALVIAENLYQNGYSVVSTVSTFHPEFMEHASSTPVPSYQPIDCHDMLVHLTEINNSLEKKHPGRFGKRALVGLSLGGYQTLYLAANTHRTDASLLKFDRYLAINPPIDLRYSNKQLDSYYESPQQWPSDVRQARINNTLHKAAIFPFLPEELRKTPKFDGIESKYLVGLTFRLALRDSIFNSQYRHNLGIIKTPLKKSRRDAAYFEILQYSFSDYLTKFALPYFQKQGITAEKFYQETTLATYKAQLRSNPDVRVITNKDDFINSSKDLNWLKSTLGTRMKVFPTGGHVGDVAAPAVDQATLTALAGLKENSDITYSAKSAK